MSFANHDCKRARQTDAKSSQVVVYVCMWWNNDYFYTTWSTIRRCSYSQGTEHNETIPLQKKYKSHFKEWCSPIDGTTSDHRMLLPTLCEPITIPRLSLRIYSRVQVSTAGETHVAKTGMLPKKYRHDDAAKKYRCACRDIYFTYWPCISHAKRSCSEICKLK